MEELDVLIPTSMQGLENLLFNVRGIFSQELDVRITIASSVKADALKELLTDREMESMRFIEDAPVGQWGNAASKYAMENFNWANWFYSIGDDDAILPWGLKHLMANRKGVSMVIGQALCVSKNGQKDLTHYHVGRVISVGKVSGVCALFNFRDIEKLGKPYWIAESPVSDFQLINRMSMEYKYKIIPNTVCCLALAEVE